MKKLISKTLAAVYDRRSPGLLMSVVAIGLLAGWGLGLSREASSAAFFANAETTGGNVAVQNQLSAKLTDQFLNQLATCSVH